MQIARPLFIRIQFTIFQFPYFPAQNIHTISKIFQTSDNTRKTIITEGKTLRHWINMYNPEYTVLRPKLCSKSNYRLTETDSL